MPTEMIDLGDDWKLPAADPGGRPLPDLRRHVVYALVLLLVATLGAAAAPVREVTPLGLHDLGAMTTRPGGEVMQPAGDLLLVQGAGTLSAYGSTDGTLRWRVPYSTAQADAGYLTGSADVVLAVDGDQLTTGFDARTGAALWASPRSVYPVGGVGVAVDDNTGESETPTPGTAVAEPDVVTGLDLRTGRELWTVRGTPFSTVDSERGLVVTVTSSGELAVYDVRDGRLLRRGEAAFPPGRPMYVAAYLDVIQLASAQPNGDGLTYLDYDLTTLQPQASDAGMPYPCGRFRCVHRDDQESRESFRITVTDPGTGAQLWQLDQNAGLLPVRDGFVILDVGRSSGSRGVDAVRLVDPGTGRTLVDLAGWLALGAVDGGDDYLLLRDVGKATQLARVVDGAIRVLGELPYATQRCLYRAERLSCVLGERQDRLGIWRVDGRGGR